MSLWTKLAKFRFRRGTQEQINDKNPTLDLGEPLVSTSDTSRLWVGDGTTAVDELDEVGSTVAAEAVQGHADAVDAHDATQVAYDGPGGPDVQAALRTARTDTMDRIIAADYIWDLADPGVRIGGTDGLWGERDEARVEFVPNRGSVEGFDLHADNGGWQNLIVDDTPGPFPGPIWVPPTSHRLSTRPACRMDSLDRTGEVAIAQLDSNVTVDLHAMLSPQRDPHAEADWFNSPDGYEQPWHIALLVRNEPVGSANAVIDTEEGGPTIGGTFGADPQKWGMTTGFPVSEEFNWDGIEHELSPDETVLVVAYFDGADSTLAVTYRDEHGELQTVSGSTEMGTAGTMSLVFFGLHAEFYLSAAAIKIGQWDEGEVARLREWASRWIPAKNAAPVELHDRLPRRLAGAIAHAPGVSVANTTQQTTLLAEPLSIDALQVRVGDAVQVSALVKFENQSGQDAVLTVRLKFNGTVFSQPTLPALPSGSSVRWLWVESTWFAQGTEDAPEVTLVTKSMQTRAPVGDATLVGIAPAADVPFSLSEAHEWDIEADMDIADPTTVATLNVATVNLMPGSMP